MGQLMNVELHVFDPNEDQEIIFGDYQFRHAGCGLMTNKHVIAHDEFVLKCHCGLEIHFPQSGPGMTEIIDSVIDGQVRELGSEVFHSNFASSIRIVPAGAA